MPRCGIRWKEQSKVKSEQHNSSRARIRSSQSFFVRGIFQFISSSSSQNDSCSAFGQNLLLLLLSFAAAHPPPTAPSSIILEMKKPKNGPPWKRGKKQSQTVTRNDCAHFWGSQFQIHLLCPIEGDSRGSGGETAHLIKWGRHVNRIAVFSTASATQIFMEISLSLSPPLLHLNHAAVAAHARGGTRQK